jgi:hypothetical protein
VDTRTTPIGTLHISRQLALCDEHSVAYAAPRRTLNTDEDTLQPLPLVFPLEVARGFVIIVRFRLCMHY